MTSSSMTVSPVSVSVSVHVASVWYTQSAALLVELQSCVTEFKQYLANLARSIRAAAADMAIGLVLPQTRLELEYFSLYSKIYKFLFALLYDCL